MKKFTHILSPSLLIIGFSLSAVFLPQQANAQAPEKMSYQAVIRDASGALVSNQTLGMRISILQASPQGPPVYVETQKPKSNANGLVSLAIGTGNLVSGNFAAINWAHDKYFIKTATDLKGGTAYTITVTNQLMSVPYALYAKKSGSSIAGPQGTRGQQGNGIAITTDNGDGTFTLTFDDETIFTTIDLTGPAGRNGSNGNGIATTTDNHDGTFTLTFDDGSTFITANLTGPAGSNGNDGNGIASTTDNGDGTFTLTFDDGSTFMTADLTGPAGSNGNNGNGIASTTDNGDGTFTLNFDDATTFITSNLTGPAGSNGNNGNGIASTIDNGDGTFTLTFDDATTFITADLRGAQGIQGPSGANGVSTTINPGTNITITGDGNPATPYVINASGGGSGPHYLGEEFEGGVIFYLYMGSDGLQHGLIVNLHEIPNGQWQSSTSVTNATSAWDGAYNTPFIHSASTNSAAAYINGLTDGGFSDWYMPSINELCLLWHSGYHVNKAFSAISGATLLASSTYKYWSSTDYNQNYAVHLNFTTGNPTTNSFKVNTHAVRGIRAF